MMFSILLLLFPLLVSAYSNPGACSGACNTHDPSLIQRTSDGTWFLFSTGGGIGISTASSISGSFTSVGEVLSSGSKIDLTGNTDLWAPDVHYVSGTYYLYYAVSTFGSQSSAIGVATSTTLEPGSWTDHGATGIASASGKAYNAIDPNLLEVSSTEFLFSFGSFWDDIYGVTFASPPLTAASGASSSQLSYNSSGTHAQEGSFRYYSSSTGYYYLLISSGICCGYDTSLPSPGDEYRIIMGRSTSPTGPFVDKDGKDMTAGGGSTLLKSHGYVYGPGGQGVYTASSLGDVLYYHYADTDVGLADADYLFGWNVLTYSSGWPAV